MNHGTKPWHSGVRRRRKAARKQRRLAAASAAPVEPVRIRIPSAPAGAPPRDGWPLAAWVLVVLVASACLAVWWVIR